MEIESFLFIIWVVFVIFINVFCFTVFPIKVVKSKKLNPLLKGSILGGVLGSWIWLEDCDFFINIGGSDMERIEAINNYTGFPALPALIVFFSAIGLLMGLLANLFTRLLIGRENKK